MRTWACGIYDERPMSCQLYPQPGHYRPPECGFTFDEEGSRLGECLPECGATCCKMPRQDGEPGGVALPAVAGGLPCRHLVLMEEQEKVASVAREVFDVGCRGLVGS